MSKNISHDNMFSYSDMFRSDTASTHWWVRFFAAMLHERARDIPANFKIRDFLRTAKSV